MQTILWNYNWLDLTGYIDGLYDYWTVACMGIMFLILAVISWFLVVKRVIKTTE